MKGVGHRGAMNINLQGAWARGIRSTRPCEDWCPLLKADTRSGRARVELQNSSDVQLYT